MTCSFGYDEIANMQDAQTGENGVDVISYTDAQEGELSVMEDYVNKTLGSEYDSFEEALAAAQSIDPNEVNPFPLAEEVGLS